MPPELFVICLFGESYGLKRRHEARLIAELPKLGLVSCMLNICRGIEILATGDSYERPRLATRPLYTFLINLVL